MEELTAIELLREVLLGEKKENSQNTACKPKSHNKQFVATTKLSAKPADDE